MALRPFRIPLSPFPFRLSHPRSALTLIELLVTIVILVTLLGAVLPAISPNNDARKIREASRQLTSLFAQAQAQAARDGRPVGVGFRDPWVDANQNGVFDAGEMTGMALEAYIIAEPPAFTGFASSSSVLITPPNASVPTFTRPLTAPLLNMTFGRGLGREIDKFASDTSDWIPPQMFRGARLDPDLDGSTDTPGDIIEVGDEQFEILDIDCDDIDDTDAAPDVETFNNIEYLRPQTTVTVRWLTWRYRNISLAPQGAKAFRIRRPPANNISPSRTSAEALQFPRGIGIDFDPSDGNASMGIVFSPNGSVEAIYQDDHKLDPMPVYILLGRVENANAPTGQPRPNDLDYTRYDFSTGLDNDQLSQRRTEVNLLNADSRWVVVAPSGRIVGAENFIFNPNNTKYVSGQDGNTSPLAQRDRQREEAQHYAEDLEAESGG